MAPGQQNVPSLAEWMNQELEKRRNQGASGELGMQGQAIAAQIDDNLAREAQTASNLQTIENFVDNSGARNNAGYNFAAAKNPLSGLEAANTRRLQYQDLNSQAINSLAALEDQKLQREQDLESERLKTLADQEKTREENIGKYMTWRTQAAEAGLPTTFFDTKLGELLGEDLSGVAAPMGKEQKERITELEAQINQFTEGEKEIADLLPKININAIAGVKSLIPGVAGSSESYYNQLVSFLGLPYIAEYRKLAGNSANTEGERQFALGQLGLPPVEELSKIPNATAIDRINQGIEKYRRKREELVSEYNSLTGTENSIGEPSKKYPSQRVGKYTVEIID